MCNGVLFFCRWLTDFDTATWDLAAFYFGKKGNFTCDRCVHVESGTGTKWSFLYKFGMSDIFQNTFSKQYKQVLATTSTGQPQASSIASH